MEIAKFDIRRADDDATGAIARELALPDFIAATLVSRGIDTPEAARAFLEPFLDRDWLDPGIIPGLEDVADALEAAIKAHQHILVFGDFDLDGISSTSVLTRALRTLGADVTPFIRAASTKATASLRRPWPASRPWTPCRTSSSR